MQKWMKKLERTVPGPQHGDLPRTRLIGFQASIDDTENYLKKGDIYHNSHSSDQAEDTIYIYMRYSYFLLPEAFEEDDEILYAAIEDLQDKDAIWLPDDFPEEGGIPEDVFVTVLANYGQVRKFLHTKL